MSNYKVGDTLSGKYEIKAVLGAGGMGSVYRARQIDLGRDVAIKVPLPAALEIPGFLARFAREARTCAKLTHDNVVQVYEFVQSDDECYIVLEFVEGTDLKNLVSRPPAGLKVEDLAIILRSSCEGLAHAHEFGIVHRDIKPHNIMVQRRGRGKWRTKIMDFGIAHLDADSNLTQNQEQLTVTGQAIGTPTYMSPEQIRGTGVTHQSDIYSFGCVIFFMFTGQTPFMGTGFTVAAAHLSDTPPLVRARLPQVPEQLDQIIQRCLAKDPGARPDDASDLGQEIYEALQPIFDVPMAELWPKPAEGEGGTDILKPTARIPASHEANPTLAATVSGDAPQPGGAALEAATGAPTVAAPNRLSEELPSLSSSESATLTDAPAAERTAGATRTGTAMPSGAGDRTVDFGSGGTSAGPATYDGPAAQPVGEGSQKKLLMIGGGAFAGLLLLGIGLGVVLSGGGDDPGAAGNGGGAQVAGGGPAGGGPGGGEPSGGTGDPGGISIDPTATETVTPAPEPSEVPPTEVAQVNLPSGPGENVLPEETPDTQAVTPSPSPTEPPETATPSPPPTESPSPSPTRDPVEVRVANLQQRLAGASGLLEQGSLWASLMRDDYRADPRLVEVADALARQVATSPQMVAIDEGTYTRGDTSTGPNDPMRANNVTLSGFSIGATEVTALEFSAFLNRDPQNGLDGRFEEDPAFNITWDGEVGRWIPREGRELHPANGVTWQEASDYTNWLATITGRGFRLPTEAEWEVAARGGDTFIYPSGDQPPARGDANFDAMGTMDVTQGRAYDGIYHMAGNVYEWVQDWYLSDAYSSLPADNPVAASKPTIERRVARGGSFRDRSEDLSAVTRHRFNPTSREADLGFRLAEE